MHEVKEHAIRHNYLFPYLVSTLNFACCEVVLGMRNKAGDPGQVTLHLYKIASLVNIIFLLCCTLGTFTFFIIERKDWW